VHGKGALTSARIHPSALVDPAAELASDVEVGPFAIVEAGVQIGARSKIGAYTRISGPTSIGEDNIIHSHCSIGEAPQDKKYRGQPTRLEIGHRNTIREFCTLNRGTVEDLALTRVGDDNWIMSYVHIAHDCTVGNHTVLANHATLAGHVHIGDWVTLGGFVGVHQFVQVGAHSFCGISAVITQDIPPFMLIAGNPAAPRGINSEGLKRRGFSAEAIAEIKNAYRALYRNGLSYEEAQTHIAALAETTPELEMMVAFLAGSTRGILR
jgi:UDP-N-acetylglucosamine acyltransferase